MFSRMAMYSISGVMMPCFAYQNCVTGWPALARSGRRDPSSVLQMALVGTVLHLLAQIALGTTLYATHAVDLHGNFVFWLLGEYWLSLIALIWQLKRMISSVIPEAKVHN